MVPGQDTLEDQPLVVVRIRPVAQRATVLGLSLLAALGCAELVVRSFFPVAYLSYGAERYAGGFHQLYRASAIPGLEYELVPSVSVTVGSGVEVRTNAWGLRSPEVARTKPGGAVRIAAVGDSFTFGDGVENDETLPACLQRRLAELLPGRALEVLNFGVSGYSTRDEVLLVRERVLAFEPDLILLVYTLNDPETHPDHLLHRVFHRPAAWERWHLLRLLARWRHGRALARYRTYEQYLHDPAAGHWASVQQGFAALRESTVPAGLPVLVVLMPMMRSGMFRNYASLATHERVAAEARGAGFEIFDLLEPLRASGHVVAALRNAEDAHLNPLGNRLAAEALAGFLVERYPRVLAD